jgi:hypothetical protein
MNGSMERYPMVRILGECYQTLTGVKIKANLVSLV